MAPGSEQLTIAAKALGFDESAKSVDVLTAAEKRLVDVQAQLANAKVSGSVSEVASLTSQQARLTEVTKQLGTEQTKLNASSSDFIGVLTAISPMLGRWTDAALKGATVAGDFSSKSINLASAGKLGTEVLIKYAGALKLLGAAGVALAGFSALAKSIREIREEAERSRKAIVALREAHTDLARSNIDAAGSVVAGRDARGDSPPFTADQRDSVRRTIAASPEGLRDKIKPLLEVFGGAKGFGPEPGEFTGAELEALARQGFTAKDGVGLQRNTESARRFLSRNKGNFEAIQQRDRDVAQANRGAAVDQALGRDPSGNDAELRKIVEEVAKRNSVDPDLVQRQVEKELARQAAFLESDNGPTGGLSRSDDVAAERKRRSPLIQRRNDSESVKVDAGEGETRAITPTEISAIDEVVNKLLPTLDRSKGLGTRPADSPINVFNDFRNSKFIGRDAASQRRLSRIPEVQLRQRAEP